MPAGSRQPERTELLRCRVTVGEGRSARLEPIERQGSGMLSTLLEADGIAEVLAGDGSIRPGDPLPFLAWQDLGIN